MVQRKALLIEAGHQVFDELDAADLPDLSAAYATPASVAAAIAALVNSSPSALDTLKELSDALGADPNFATTMATALGGKVPTTRTITAGTGLTGGGTLEADRTLAPDFGTGAGKVTQGNDSRLTDARTPTAHATSHQSGGSDAIKLDDLTAPDDNTDLNVSTTAHGLAPKAPNDATKFLNGVGAYSTPAGGSAPVGAADLLYLIATYR